MLLLKIQQTTFHITQQKKKKKLLSYQSQILPVLN